MSPMNHESEIGRVDLPHDVRKLLFLPGVVRHVADEGEFESPTLSLGRGAARKAEHAPSTYQEQGQPPHDVLLPESVKCHS
jgi:hypothetical protein